jgi:hypothetical protein
VQRNEIDADGGYRNFQKNRPLIIFLPQKFVEKVKVIQ